MTAKPLPDEDILKLETLFISVFSYLDTLRELTSLAEKIQYPKVPAILSESLAVRLHDQLFKGSSSAEFGKPASDVRVFFPDGPPRRAEVKATGESAFEYFGKKDLEADYLVWVHFGRYFHGRKGPILIYCLADPSKYFPHETKIVLKDFLKSANGKELTKLERPTISSLLGKTMGSNR